MFSYLKFVLNSGDAGAGGLAALGAGYLAVQCGAPYLGGGMMLGAVLNVAVAVGVNYGWGYLSGGWEIAKRVLETIKGG